MEDVQTSGLMVRIIGRTAIMFSALVMYICNVGQMVCLHFLDDNKGVSSKGPSITSIPKEGPSIARLSKEPIPKELLAWYGYDIVEDYLPVAKKPIPKVIFKSPIPIKGCVLGLANVETWDNIVKKFGMRTPGICSDKSKGKRKV
ncbi:hypothetical protein Tco_0603581 [Tanacetum coccineum]